MYFKLATQQNAPGLHQITEDTNMLLLAIKVYLGLLAVVAVEDLKA